MKQILVIAGIMATLGAPVTARGYAPDNDLSTARIQNGVQVTGGTSLDARAVWCAASDFAFNQLGASGSQNLFVSEPRSTGSDGYSRVSFTLDPAGLVPADFLFTGSSLGRPGAMLTINHALSFCAELPVR